MRNAYDSDTDISDLSDFELPLKPNGISMPAGGISSPNPAHSDLEPSERGKHSDDSALNARIVAEELGKLQYWRAANVGIVSEGVPRFDFRDPSALGL